MTTLRIEHAVADFDAWKRTFDAYAQHRARGGVRRYRVMRPVDDPRYSVIDLEFDDGGAAQAFLAMLESLWRRVEGTLITAPRARIVETIEEGQPSAASAAPPSEPA